MISEKEGEIAFSYHSKIAENEQKRRQLLAENAKLLSSMKDGLYKAILGDENGEWSGYLGQIEVMYSRNTVYNMIRIYDKFTSLNIPYEDVSDIPKSRLLDLLPVCDSNNVIGLCDKARVLTNQDWQNEIRSLKGLPTTEDCQHSFKEYEICAQCGLKHKKECSSEIPSQIQ